MRSIDGEVVSKLRLEKKKRTAKLCSAKFMLHALLEEISANEDKTRTFTQKNLCVPQGLLGMPMASPSGELATQQMERDIP